MGISFNNSDSEPMAYNIFEHYEIEKELANKLKNASKNQRKNLYRLVYEELFEKVPNHPYYHKKEDIAETVKYEDKFLNPSGLLSLTDNI